MADIILSGYYGFGNAGDEAMLLSILGGLRKECPDYSIAVISGRPKETREAHPDIEVIHRFDYLEITRALRKAKLLLSGGGSLLQDVTSHRSIFYYLSILKLAQCMGVPTMLYAQGIGPVTRPMAQKALKKVVDQVDLITVRDEKSQAELIRLGVTKPPIYITADPVLSLQPESMEEGHEILLQAGYQSKRPLIGFAVREWSEGASYLQEIAKVADQLIVEEDAEIVFIPMQWPEDGDAARKISQYMVEKPILLEGEFKVRQHLSLLANLDLLVGVRLHGLIFAVLAQVPRLGLSYDPKIDSFLEILGDRPVSSLENLQSTELFVKIQQTLQEEKNINDEKLQYLRNSSEENARHVAQLLKKKTSRN